jgi:hypothetical protein
MKLQPNQVTEFEPHKFCTEASSLGWKPGYWPSTIETDIGNGRPFLCVSVEDEAVHYKQEYGCCLLHVFND